MRVLTYCLNYVVLFVVVLLFFFPLAKLQTDVVFYLCSSELVGRCLRQSSSTSHLPVVSYYHWLPEG